MITQGADALIIAAIDGTALSSQLQAAADAGIPVISYDRLIRDSENVDFYVSFDNFKVGVAQGNALLTGLGVLNEDGSDGHRDRAVQHRAVRRLAGRQQRHFFFDGAMSVLAAEHRRRHAGREVRPDRHRAGRHPALAAGDRAEAHGGPADLQLQRRLARSTASSRPYDGLSRGIITALQNAGYGPTRRANPMPIVTGQDAEIASVKLIADGVQSSTIFKDTRLLAEQAVIAAEAFLEGDEPRGERHRDLRQRRQGRPVLPAAGRDRLQGRHPGGPDRLRTTGRPKRSPPARPTDHRTMTGRARWRQRCRARPHHPHHRTARRPAAARPAAAIGLAAHSAPRPHTRATHRTSHSTTRTTESMADNILEMRSITKTFPGVKALEDVNLDVRRGEIHAICGENGAGKSTLMKVLSGRLPDRQLRRRDRLRRRARPRSAASATASTSAS